MGHVDMEASETAAESLSSASAAHFHSQQKKEKEENNQKAVIERGPNVDLKYLARIAQSHFRAST